MEFKEQLITPTIAKQYLEANIRNRSVKMAIVLRYANEMSIGQWKRDTGETIKISKTGIILDGQHRLLALIKANVSLKFHVATGIEDSVFDVIDTGSTRNATDCFKIEGIKHGNTIPSIMSKYYLLKTFKSTSRNTNNRLTIPSLLKMYYEREAYWQDTAAQTHKWYLTFAKILKPSLIGGMYSLFYDIDADDAFEFTNQMATGQNITNNSIGFLRQKLMQDKMSQRKMSMSLKDALIIKSWNFYRKGEDIKQLKFNTASDKFPIAI